MSLQTCPALRSTQLPAPAAACPVRVTASAGDTGRAAGTALSPGKSIGDPSALEWLCFSFGFGALFAFLLIFPCLGHWWGPVHRSYLFVAVPAGHLRPWWSVAAAGHLPHEGEEEQGMGTCPSAAA